MFGKFIPHNDRGVNLHFIPSHGSKRFYGSELYNLPNKLTFGIYSPDGEPIDCIRSDIIEDNDNIENKEDENKEDKEDEENNDYYHVSLGIKFTAVEYHLEDYMESTLREQGASVSRSPDVLPAKNY